MRRTIDRTRSIIAGVFGGMALVSFSLATAALVSLGGCKATDEAVRLADRLVSAYCERLSPEDRAFARQEFSARSQHKVTVDCAP